MFKDPALWICAWAGRYRDDEAPPRGHVANCVATAQISPGLERSPVSKSLVALRIRSLADCGEHAAGTPGAGVKGPQVQILSSRRETAGQRPFRTKSEAASLLPCSNGVATAHVLTSPLLLRAAGRRSAPSVETAARRYAVAPPPRACARQISATACADRHRSFPRPWLPLIARSAS